MTLNQKGLPATLINKEFEFAGKTFKELRFPFPKADNIEEPLVYVSTYNMNNRELFTKIIKNLEQLKNNDKIKNVRDTTTTIKSKIQQKHLKHTLISSTFGEYTKEEVSKYENERCGTYIIIIEGNYYTLDNPKTTFIINRNLSYNSKNVVYIIECCNCEKVHIGSLQALNK